MLREEINYIIYRFQLTVYPRVYQLLGDEEKQAVSPHQVSGDEEADVSPYDIKVTVADEIIIHLSVNSISCRITFSNILINICVQGFVFHYF